MGFSFFIAIVILVGGSFGLPMGMPPGPEDPMMSRVAPEECLFYTSWVGVAKLDPKANPTEKWMSQPKASKLIPKLRKLYRAYLTRQAESTSDKHSQLLAKLIVEVIDAGSVQPVAVYIDEFGLENGVKASGAAVIKLGDRHDIAAGLMKELHTSLSAVAAKDSPSVAFKPLKIEGQISVEIFDGTTEQPAFITIRDGYFFIGLGEGSVQEAIANSKTPQPKWLAGMRKRVKVDRFASVGYLNGKVVDRLSGAVRYFDPFWFNNLDWLKGIQSVGWVNGLDSKGYIGHTEVQTDKDDSSFFALIDQGNIPQRDLKDIPADSTLAFASRVSKDEIMKMIQGSMQNKAQKDMYKDVLSQFEDLSGLSLEKELLNSIDNYVYVYYKFELDRIFEAGGWVASVKIADEMSFPEYLRQINKGVKAWAEGNQQTSFNVTKFGQYEIQQIDSNWNQYDLSWTLVDDEWLFANSPEEIISHLKNRKKKNQYLARQTAREIYDFGDKQGFGAPLAIGHLDLADVFGKLKVYIDQATESDLRLSPSFDLRFSDIPSTDELINEVEPNYAAVFKTETGFRIYQRQTYPGGTFAASFGAAAIAAIPDRMGTLASRKRLHSIAQAHLEFEKKHKRLCAPYSTDPNGGKLLSWRVHLLPFLGQEDLYAQFRLDEAWDSDHNSKLVEKIPAVYQHPTMELKKGHTAFLAPTKKGNVFDSPGKPGEKVPLGIRADQIKDGRDKTLMVQEVNIRNATEWTKPQDLPTEKTSLWMESSQIRETNYLVLALCDGSVRTLHARSGPNLMSRLTNRADGAKIDFSLWFFK